MARASSAIAISGLWVAIIAVQIFPYLDHSGAMDGAQAPLLDAAVREVVLQTFFTAVTFIYVHIHNGGGGGAGAGNQWIPEVVTFILSVSIGLLEVSLFPQPGAIDDSAQAPSLGVASVHALLPSATVTFILAMTLIYVHVRAGNGPIQADVELLTKMTLGATLVSLMAIVLAVYTSLSCDVCTIEWDVDSSGSLDLFSASSLVCPMVTTDVALSMHHRLIMSCSRWTSQ